MVKTLQKIIIIYSIVLLSTYNLYSQEKTNIAVAEFEGKGISAMDAGVVTDFIRTGFVKTGKYKVIDRNNMQLILQEQKFQITGCTSQECAVKIGKLLNVQKVVVGTISKLGSKYFINANIVDVETGQIIKSEKVKADSIEEFADKSEELAVLMTSGKVETINQISQTENVSEEIIGKDEVKMVLIPAGEFMMGSPEGEGEKDEHPQHKVYLDAYYIDKYEVTNEQYAKFLNEYGKHTDENGQKMIYKHKWGVKKSGGRWQPASGYEKNPVVNVTWYGANQYARYYGKRLPTEAEWEKACRAGSTTKYCFGDVESELGEYAWYEKNSGGMTNPVGRRKPNQYGLYDMHGNVWEWCSDWYDEKYYRISPDKNPEGPDKGSYRVLRGGSWYNYAYYCRSSSRLRYYPVFRYFNYGFRCVSPVRTQ